MGILDHLTCLLRNLYAGQEATVRNGHNFKKFKQESIKWVIWEHYPKEATVRTGHGTTDGSKQEKEYVKAVYCHPAYLTYMQSTS